MILEVGKKGLDAEINQMSRKKNTAGLKNN
jgi:hypothetical protein